MLLLFTSTKPSHNAFLTKSIIDKAYAAYVIPKTWLSIFVLFVVMISANLSLAQRIDSTRVRGSITHDTFYIIHEQIPKSKFLGNSWYTAIAYNRTKTNEFDFNLGRTYGSSFCGGAGCNFTIRSWGLGYGIAFNNGKTSQLLKAFWEYTTFYLPPLGIRTDYIYDLTTNSHYLRPSLGISLFRLDLLYHYTFKLSGNENLFKHGITVRYKYFFKQKNWQKNYPNRC